MKRLINGTYLEKMKLTIEIEEIKPFHEFILKNGGGCATTRWQEEIKIQLFVCIVVVVEEEINQILYDFSFC